MRLFKTSYRVPFTPDAADPVGSVLAAIRKHEVTTIAPPAGKPQRIISAKRDGDGLAVELFVRDGKPSVNLPLSAQDLLQSAIGKTIETDRWFAEIRVNGRPRRVGLFTDKGASDEFGRKLQRLHDRTSANDEPDLALRQWIGKIPADLAKNLIKMNLLDPKHVSSNRMLIDQLEDYRQHLIAQRRDDRYIEETISQIKAIAKECGFHFWPDVNVERITLRLAKMHDRGRGIKTRTMNGYITAFRSFAAWALENEKIMALPMGWRGFKKHKIDDEVERRGLSVEEMRVLIEHTERAPERFGMAGPERAMLYRVAVETGLRAGELQSLTRGSFNLDSDNPAVTVLARNSKNKKTESLYLSAELAELLRRHLEFKLKGVAAFNVPDHTHTAEMFRADYTGARAGWIAAAPMGTGRDARERTSFLAETDDLDRPLVFHCLRHTCGVWAFQYKKMSPREVQSLMRVSSLKLVDRYTKSFNVDTKDRANLIPSLSTAPAAVPRTGTGG